MRFRAHPPAPACSPPRRPAPNHHGASDHDHPARPVRLARLADDPRRAGRGARFPERAGRHAAAARRDRRRVGASRHGRRGGDDRRAAGDDPRFRRLPRATLSPALSRAGRARSRRAHRRAGRGGGGAGPCRSGARLRSRRMGAAAARLAGGGYPGRPAIDQQQPQPRLASPHRPRARAAQGGECAGDRLGQA